VKSLLLTADFPARPGGMARYHAELARGLGRDCTVAVGSWQGAAPLPRANDAGYQTLQLPFDARASHRPWNLWRARRMLGARVRRDPPQLVIAGNLRPLGPLAAHLARAAGAPLVQILHGGDLLQASRRWGRHPLKRYRLQRLLGAARLHAVNSRYTARLAERLGVPRERIALVPPEVDTDHFTPSVSAPAREARRRELGFDARDTVALFVGRLVERKGLGDLFSALHSLLASDAALARRLQLLVAGPGDLAHWQQRAREAGVAERVRLLGPVDREALPDLYRAADLFVGPSRDSEAHDDPESFGIVFLEAAACGLAVLATRTGGIPEAVDEGASGLLVPPGDAAALAAAWRRLALDEDLRDRLGRAGLRGPAARRAAGSSARALERALAQDLARVEKS
jgi:phosphatidylinositol alpha-1,6-mannosyltransferase